MHFHVARLASCASLVALTANALSLDTSSSDSIKSAAKSVAYGLIAQYDGNQTGNPIGVFGQPYYWWSSGLVWESMVDYWSLTGDTTYNDLVYQALLAQRGPGEDFLSPNWTAQMANDDQSTWAAAALTAAERNFTAPPAGNASWADIAANVFDTQVLRWDEANCSGGLRWQILPFSTGYDFKSTSANGQFFELAARLAKLTGNQTYADWAEKTYDWLVSTGFVTTNGTVYQGARVDDDCAAVSKTQLTSDAASVLYGSAVMFNLTKGDSKWSKAVDAILGDANSTFFQDGVMVELACESFDSCTTDMRFYKGVLARDLARTAQVAPYTADTILPLLKTSAQAAASNACNDANGFCGFEWQNTDTASARDLGAQLSALEIIQANLVPSTVVSESGSGTSTSGNNSGNGSGGASGGGSSGGSDKNAGGSLKFDLHSSSGFGYGVALLAAGMFFMGIL